MLEVRKANSKDYNYISVVLAHCEVIDYIDKDRIKQDIENDSCFILQKENKRIGFLSLVYDKKHNAYYLKRGLIPNKRNRGRGYSKILFEKVISFINKGSVVCVTPWEENIYLRRMLCNIGFEYQYTFQEKYMLYQKII